MPFEIITKLGVHTIRTTGKDLREAMELSGFLAELPDHCPVCSHEGKNTLVSLFHRETQDGFHYYGLRCKAFGKDAHETAFGQLKDGSGFWYKGEWKRVGDFNKGREDEPQRARGADNQGRRTNQPGSEFEE